MKPLFFIALILTMTAAEAKFFSRVDKHINIKTGEVLDINEDTIDLERGEATYYSHAEYKKKTVLLSDLSRETREELNGLKQGEFFLADDKNGQTVCEVWHLFENGSGYVGCRTNQRMKNIGVARPQRANVILSSVYHPSVVAEVESLDGFKTKDIAVLDTASERNEAGTIVRVEAVFANGEALIQKQGFNLLDTSGLLLKYSVEKVKLSQLKKITE